MFRVEHPIDIPVRSNRLALGRLLQLLHGGRANVLQVISAGVRDDGIPDDSLIGGIHAALRGRPLGSHVDEDLLRVPGEELGQVRIEGELDDRVLLLDAGVVVWATLDDLEVLDLEGAGGRALRVQVGGGDEAS